MAMKMKTFGIVLVALALAFILTVNAQPRPQNDRAEKHVTSEHARAGAKKPLKLVGAILVPGNPIRFDISWVDQARARYYLAESGNAAVDVFDAENNLFIGRISGFHGLAAADDPCGRIEGMGPNGVVVTPDNHLWADDAHGTVKVFDLSNAQPPFSGLSPVATISTGAVCRADELGFDPKDRVIVVGNPEEHPPFATIISSDAPYEVLSKIPFPDASGLEQPLWDSGLKGGRMLLTVPGKGEGAIVAVLDLTKPKSPVVERTYSTPNCGSGLALGSSQHLLVGCGGGRPLILVNALTGKILTTIADTHGADEVWYNAGDNHFYAPSGFSATPTLSVIDAESGKLLYNLPAGPVSHSVAVYSGNNHVFVPIATPTPASPADACNVLFGLPEKQGCIAVYAPGK
jgi:DNA-binding beta-propeller fold protein YncE